MIKQVFFGFLHGADPLKADRWYLRYHSQEFVHWFGPWVRRYQTFRSRPPQGEAAEWAAARDGFYTEIWFSNLDDFHETGAQMTGWMKAGPTGRTVPYTPFDSRGYTNTLAATMTLVPAVPTSDFLGKEPNPDEPLIRWVRVFRYPDGIDRAECDAAFTGEHAERWAKAPGLKRYIAFQALDYPPMTRDGAYGPWHRVEELWFEDLDAWGAAVEAVRGATPAADAPHADTVSCFVRARCDYDFLVDRPRVP